MLDTSPLKTLMSLGFIRIYAGTVPSTADASIGAATLLCILSNNDTGTGLTLDAAAASGIIAKNTGETWSGTNSASGTATFYRHVAVGDTGGASTTEARIQGTIALAGGEVNLSSVNLSVSALQTLDYYVVALPTL